MWRTTFVYRKNEHKTIPRKHPVPSGNLLYLYTFEGNNLSLSDELTATL